MTKQFEITEAHKSAAKELKINDSTIAMAGTVIAHMTLGEGGEIITDAKAVDDALEGMGLTRDILAQSDTFKREFALGTALAAGIVGETVFAGKNHPDTVSTTVDFSKNSDVSVVVPFVKKVNDGNMANPGFKDVHGSASIRLGQKTNGAELKRVRTMLGNLYVAKD